jgi:AcrR family transcriptional regulator
VRVVTDRLPHRLRSDARDNRELILDAARAVFAAEGLNVPMREIARRAGVGPATLYRRFPTKEALVTEALAGQMRACQAIVDEGLADPDPWQGFCLVIEKICALHARNRGFTAAFMSAYPNAMDFAADRDYALRSIASLARRARDAGRLRPDFVLDDLILMLMANSGIRATSPAAAVAASRRFAALAIQAFQAVQEASPLPPAVRLAPVTLLVPHAATADYGQHPLPRSCSCPAPAWWALTTSTSTSKWRRWPPACCTTGAAPAEATRPDCRALPRRSPPSCATSPWPHRSAGASTGPSPTPGTAP